MEENINDKLLNKIFYLQEDLASKKQENKKLRETLKKCENCIRYLNEENKRQEKKTRDREIRTFYIGIGFTILLFLLKKILLWYFF